jgi:hypothetical protein
MAPPPGFGALAFAFALAAPDQRRRRVEHLAGFCLVSGLFYLPIFFCAGMTLSFLRHAGPPNNYLAAHPARFAWKTVMIYGLAGAAVLAWTLLPRLWQLRRGSVWRDLSDRRLVALTATIATLAYSTAMFIYLPAEVGYQLPSVFAVAALLALLDVPAALRAVLVATHLAL